MSYDFFIHALLAGTGLALLTGPLGCIVVWRRMSFFGDTLAHASLLGVALSLITDINLNLAVVPIVAGVALALLWLTSRRLYSSDHMLGLLSHSMLALGLIAITFTSRTADLMGLFFGDILSTTADDVITIYAGGALVLGVLMLIWHRLFASCIHPELAQAEGMRPMRTNSIFLLLLALVVAMAIKIIGVLLITALLLLPAATARRLTSTPETMAIVAAICGVISVGGGLTASLYHDTPSSPSIVVTALCLFILVNIPRRNTLIKQQ